MRMNEKHNNTCSLKEARLYKIGMFAQMNHVTIKTLHFYEEQGLLYPAFVDEENGYRYYTMDQMAVIHQITALKLAGLTLEDIKSIRSGVDETLLLHKKKSQLLASIAQLTKQVATIDGYIYDKTGSLDTPVLVKVLPAVTVASMQKCVDSYDEYFSLMPQMGAEMERLGLKCALPEYCFTRYLDKEFKEEQILVEACEAITGKKKDSELVKCIEIPETMAACAYHKGSYDSFSKSYERVLRFIEDNGYEVNGPIRESYIDGVWNREKEEEWLSEVQIPVRRKLL